MIRYSSRPSTNQGRQTYLSGQLPAGRGPGPRCGDVDGHQVRGGDLELLGHDLADLHLGGVAEIEEKRGRSAHPSPSSARSSTSSSCSSGDHALPQSISPRYLRRPVFGRASGTAVSGGPVAMCEPPGKRSGTPQLSAPVWPYPEAIGGRRGVIGGRLGVAVRLRPRGVRGGVSGRRGPARLLRSRRFSLKLVVGGACTGAPCDGSSVAAGHRDAAGDERPLRDRDRPGVDVREHTGPSRRSRGARARSRGRAPRPHDRVLRPYRARHVAALGHSDEALDLDRSLERATELELQVLGAGQGPADAYSLPELRSSAHTDVPSVKRRLGRATSGSAGVRPRWSASGAGRPVEGSREGRSVDGCWPAPREHGTVSTGGRRTTNAPSSQ